MEKKLMIDIHMEEEIEKEKCGEPVFFKNI